tara:strand:+ start:10513 stop:10704 length:192 start_codon:yes stop_codon:yes gene_type:complete
MSNYKDKKKYKKRIASEKKRKRRQLRRSRAAKASRKSDEDIERLKWQYREKLTPVRKPKEPTS